MQAPIRRVASRPRFAVGIAVLVACSLGRDTAGQTTVLPGTLSGTRTFNAASGSATFTGNSTLSGTVTLGLGFEVEYLVVGGGGAGGFGSGGGGGGAGGFTAGASFFASGTQNVTVGRGGSRFGNESWWSLDESTFSGQTSALGTATAGGGGFGAGADIYYSPYSGYAWAFLDAADGASGGGASAKIFFLLRA